MTGGTGRGGAGPLTWFGDDFTGSGDVLLRYTRAGVRGLLFLGTPGAAELAEAAGGYGAVGIAGVTRALPTGEIAPVVAEAFDLLAGLSPRVVQYKICSTADSSVAIGGIGPAVAAGRERFGEVPTPILAAQPDLGRYTVFGTHFGRDATGIHRLDRLPAMANHPVTPMTEADLRVHFAAQLREVGNGEVGGLDLSTVRAGAGGLALERLRGSGAAAYVVDALADDDPRRAAQLLLAGAPDCLFAVGSGGLSTGLAAELVDPVVDRARDRGRGPGGDPAARRVGGPGPDRPGPPPACLVVSGSASGTTTAQIDRAVAAGWVAIPLDPARLGAPGAARAAVEEATRAALEAFDRSRGVIVYTAHRTLLPPAGPVPSTAVGAALGELVLATRRHRAVPRVVVAGGDTSGYVLTRLRARTLSALGTVGDDLLLGTLASAASPAVGAPGGAVGGASDDGVDGLQVVLKGGQLGGPDVFEDALHTPA